MQQAPESMLHPNLQVPPGDRLAFLHIPKTAGTSLRRALSSHWREVKIIGDHRILAEMPEDGLKKVTLFTGHFYAYELSLPALRGFTPVTVLRDPLARLFSEYRWASTVAKKNGKMTPALEFALKVSFFEYAFSAMGRGRHAHLHILGGKRPPFSFQTATLAELLDNSKQTLSTMRVGVTESLDLFVAKLFSEVGAPVPPLLNLNTQERHLEYPLTKKQTETLRDILAPDFALYAFARELMNNWLAGSVGAQIIPNVKSTGPRALNRTDRDAQRKDPLLRRATRFLAREDWAAACHSFARRGVEGLPPGSLKNYAIAALELGDPTHIDRVLRSAIMADLKITERLEIAQIFSTANLPHEAWDIFVSGRHFLDHRNSEEEHLFVSVGNFLTQLGNSPAISARLKIVVFQYRLRMKNMVKEPIKLGPVQFNTSAPRATLKEQETEIFFSDRVPQKAIDSYKEQAEKFGIWRQHVKDTFVREYCNVFVNRIGQIWRPDGKILRDCMRQLPEASLKAATFAPRVPVAGLAISSKANNFYHWMADMVPSIGWRLESQANGMPMIIKDNAPSFMHQSLHILGEGSIPLLGAGDAIFVERLYEGQQAGAKIQPNGAHEIVLARLRDAGDRLIDDNGASGDLVYISRRDTKIRPMSNEEELESAVAKMGFRIVTLSSLDLTQQIALIRQAKFVLGPHGAGFTHILFSRPETIFFEITPYEPGTVAQRYCMARLSRIMGNRHAIWLEPVAPASRSWTSSIEPLVRKVTDMMDTIHSEKRNLHIDSSILQREIS
jgi:Glycosyltransferase 61/Sulfotransferase family